MLEGQFSHHDNVFVIVRNAGVIKDILDDMQGMNVVPIFIYVIPSSIRERLEKEGTPEAEIQLRLERSEEAMEDYFAHPLLYRHVLINNSSAAVYQNQLQAILEAYNAPQDDLLRISAQRHYHLPSMLVPHKAAMVERLQAHPFENNVFVMMRFAEDNRNVFKIIANAVKASGVGLTCVRADQADWAITRDSVLNPYAVLLCCKYGIAVFDRETLEDNHFRVNVAIELGIMRMLDRHCLTLLEEGMGPVPFNLEGIIYKRYRDSSDIPGLVEEWLATLR